MNHLLIRNFLDDPFYKICGGLKKEGLKIRISVRYIISYDSSYMHYRGEYITRKYFRWGSFFNSFKVK